MCSDTSNKDKMVIKNSKGQRFFGLHFYPGVAEYQEPGREPYRVFLNEDTLRKMDASFEGRPVYVSHVDGVEQDLNELRKEADGWVVKSFYNEADGKHWAEFMIVSDQGLKAIGRGMRLSNCYVPKVFSDGGLWNGVAYQREITAGEYEHLAIVPNPRYEESVILTPDEFKTYNEEKVLELKRLSNQGEKGMPFSFFKKAKVENTLDLESMCVVLPKSKREISVTQLVNEMDEMEQKKKEPQMANGEHMVEHMGKKMTVNDMMAEYNRMCDEMKGMKGDVDVTDDADGVRTEMEMENEEPEDEKKLKLAEEKEKEIVEAKRKNALAKAKAERLRNAHIHQPEEAIVNFSEDQISRGRARYGS